MAKKVSNIESFRQEKERLRVQVMNLLGWNDLQYGEFQEACGISYLRHFYGNIPLINELPSHKAFWSWWVVHWTARDREFVEMSGLLFRSELEDYYRQMHNPESMQFRPHAAILEDTWRTMIHGLVKEAVR